MTRFLLTTSSSAIHCRPNQGLGRVSVLFALEETHGFSGDASMREDVNSTIYSTIAEWLKPDQLIKSGRCRATLTPT